LSLWVRQGMMKLMRGSFISVKQVVNHFPSRVHIFLHELLVRSEQQVGAYAAVSL